MRAISGAAGHATASGRKLYGDVSRTPELITEGGSVDEAYANARDVRDAALGCIGMRRRGKGLASQAGERSTVATDQNGSDLKIGTLRAVVRQLGLEWATFERG